jgi:glycine cleavage system H protein
MKILDYEFPEGLLYSRDHLWVKVEDGKVRVGITDFAQKMAGDIVFARIMPKGRQVRMGQPLGTMETGKWVGPLKSPVSGTIIESNTALRMQPKLLNTDPYGEGWVAVLEPSNFEEEKKHLISDFEELKKFIEEEEAKYKK